MTTDFKALALAALAAVLPIDTVLAPHASTSVHVVVGESDDDDEGARPNDGGPTVRPGYEPSAEEVEAARAYLDARDRRLKAERESTDPDEQE